MFFHKYYSTPTGFIAFVNIIKTNSDGKSSHFEHQEEETWSQRDAERDTESGWGMRPPLYGRKINRIKQTPCRLLLHY